jgi:hypothetical protein
MEYKLTRTGFPDTTVRVMHSNAVENYTFSLLGTVTGVVCDPNNWVINKVIGPTFDSSLGFDELGTSVYDIKIGPNPTKGIVAINTTQSFEGRVIVLDINGKQLIDKKLGSETTLDISAYANGIYLVKITDANGIEKYSQKIIKE